MLFRSGTAPFWTLPASFLTGSAAAGGIALINSIGNLGGFVAPYAIGWIKDATGDITLGLVVLAAGPIMAGLIVILMGHDSKMEMAGSRNMKSPMGHKRERRPRRRPASDAAGVPQ